MAKKTHSTYIISVLMVVSMVAIFACSESPRMAVKIDMAPTCICCKKWISHMRQHGFTFQEADLSDIRQKTLPGSLSSCHTALVDGYIVEGHVPAEDVLRMLEERPEIAGLGVPGMPIGSPGMEGARTEAYSVFSFDHTGKTTVYASYTP